VRRRNLPGARHCAQGELPVPRFTVPRVAHCNGGNLPVLNGSSGYNGQSSGHALSDGTIARDPREPWICSAAAGLTGRI
jgi:hypothetical protein